MDALLAQLHAQGVVESPFAEEEWKLPVVNTPINDLSPSSPFDFPLYDPIPLPDEEEEAELDIECIPSPLAAVQDLYQLADEITDINLPPDLPDQPPSDDFHVRLPPISPTFTLTALIDAVNLHGKQNGYAVRKGSTAKDRKGEVAYVYLVCPYSGVYKPSHAYLTEIGPMTNRRPTTKRRGCEFKLYAKLSKGMWSIMAKELRHNHPRDPSARSQHIHRKPTAAETVAVLAAFDAGINSNRILASLRETAKRKNRETLVSEQEIYTMRSRYYRIGGGGRTRTDTLIQELKNSGSHHAAKFGQFGELTHLLITDPMALALGKHYGEVLYIDCTYRTNKFKLPLFHVVAATGANCSFTIAFGYLAREQEDDYLWAMHNLRDLLRIVPVKTFVTDNDKALRNAIDRVYPETTKLLCIWHINKNIVSRKKGIAEEDWNKMLAHWYRIVRAPTLTEFEEVLTSFAMEWTYRDDTEAACTYMMTLFNDAEYFCAYATRGKFHLNATATSVVEGSHAALKRSLNARASDLYHVTNNVLRYMTAGQYRIFTKHAHEQGRGWVELPPSLALVGSIFFCKRRNVVVTGFIGPDGRLLPTSAVRSRLPRPRRCWSRWITRRQPTVD
ncbi:hypothetical protein FFLO_02416 [Filobasidium floriforme]|uniref:MULE transposase domain-containing protein n=1 Tax=Filobasidium floriforme TaxID=5210 RepID=A0A8K0JN11_9TREE|nr:hypothetical protein FFLO_02416 [Filobasidium floriforme]